ncbi:MAG: hypothetical protein V1928_02620 [Parcubacteria group bacterium]
MTDLADFAINTIDRLSILTIKQKEKKMRCSNCQEKDLKKLVGDFFQCNKCQLILWGDKEAGYAYFLLCPKCRDNIFTIIGENELQCNHCNMRFILVGEKVEKPPMPCPQCSSEEAHKEVLLCEQCDFIFTKDGQLVK